MTTPPTTPTQPAAPAAATATQVFGRLSILTDPKMRIVPMYITRDGADVVVFDEFGSPTADGVALTDEQVGARLRSWTKVIGAEMRANAITSAASAATKDGG